MAASYAFTQSMGIYGDLIERIEQMRSEGSSQADIARLGGVDGMYVSRLLKGARKDNIQKFLNFVERIGGKIVFGGESGCATAKDVHFVHPKVLSTEEAEGPIDDDYIAVPLAAMPVAAGTGMIPEDRIKSWVLVWTGQEAVRHRSNLAAVEIGKDQISMQPTLHPGDLVLVDRDDWLPKNPPGNIYLVQEPATDEAGLAIKRVRLQRKNGRELVVFFSDNPDYVPELYDLDADYEGAFAFLP